MHGANQAAFALIEQFDKRITQAINEVKEGVRVNLFKRKVTPVIEPNFKIELPLWDWTIGKKHYGNNRDIYVDIKYRSEDGKIVHNIKEEFTDFDKAILFVRQAIKPSTPSPVSGGEDV